ncbi:hypothetical protein J2Y38_001560 [Flavobacterium sp. 2755]|uniref:hypothetical protein n=1 Tax=Flavobacterium sp. 2755 TaxID=2817765 RepID=UPI00286523B9|nr:hypothetical protein [Flavobacterium sp. 2755]MDR6761351.1 hypothetical protein [Flavobacterium sp. 2755]
MGLFNFLKKNKKTETPEIEENLISSSIKHSGKSLNEIYAEKRDVVNSQNTDNVFDFIKIYSEYIVRFIGMQIQNNYAPIAAYEKVNGEITGYLYIAEDTSYNLSATEVVTNMEIEFEKRIKENTIKSYVILYHSNFQDDNNHSVAKKNNEFTAISIKYKANDLNGFLGLPYFFADEEITFKGISTFTREQNNSILNIELQQGKDYFQERIIIEPQVTENEFGLKIKKVNNGTVGDMWAGIFGFERLGNEDGRNFLIHHSAFVLFQEPVKSNNEIIISEYISGNIIFRGVKKADETTRTVYPVIKTDIFIEVVNKQINEWENIDNLEAIITGNGRDTFGLIYFATDYAINKEKYKSNKKLNIELSGLIYSLEICSMPDTTAEGPNYSEDFTMYMPNKEMSEFGCFDFIGQLEDFREVDVLDNRPSKGYILKIKLITNEEIPDFFTIEMFVNKENMNFQDLKIGMKLSGLFQLQGQIKE